MILIGEPTSVDRLGDTVKIGRRGSVNLWIEAAGHQGHVAYPHRADNPIPPLARAITALDALVLDEGTDTFPPSNLEFTSIATPTNVSNVIPGIGDRPAQHPLQQSASWRGPRCDDRGDRETSRHRARRFGRAFRARPSSPRRASFTIWWSKRSATKPGSSPNCRPAAAPRTDAFSSSCARWSTSACPTHRCTRSANMLRSRISKSLSRIYERIVRKLVA